MTVTIFTLFPEYFTSALQQSILKRATEKGVVSFKILDIRSFTTDKHRVTDDRPFGGGAGMVMKVEPIQSAIAYWKSVHQDGTKWLVATSAAGRKFTQAVAQKYSTIDHLGIVCGHYEGIDQRVLDHLIDEEIRIGDYVLTGGEPAALVIADAVTRLLPDVLGNESSLVGESHHEEGKGNYPQYTRPAVVNDWKVPEVLQTGDHAAIEQWRESHRKNITD